MLLLQKGLMLQISREVDSRAASASPKILHPLEAKYEQRLQTDVWLSVLGC